MFTRPQNGLLAILLVLSACDDGLPEPDMALAASVRQGMPDACARTVDWVVSELRRAVSTETSPVTPAGDAAEVALTTGPSALIGITPGEAVVCRVRVTIRIGHDVDRADQSYQIALGDDFGPDFARFRFVDAGAVRRYASILEVQNGGPTLWSRARVPCSRYRPDATTPGPASTVEREQAASTLIARAKQDGFTLPPWVIEKLASIAGLGSTEVDGSVRRYGVICGPEGCENQAFSFNFEMPVWDAAREIWTGSIPVGIVRTRASPSAPHVYEAFGHTRTSYETCAHIALEEYERFQPNIGSLTRP